jgi:hypothetical protein
MNEKEKEIEANIRNYIEQPLIDSGLNIFYKKFQNIGLSLTYGYQDKIKIRFTYEFVDMMFLFCIYTLKGEDIHKEKTFWRIFMEMDPSVKYEDIQPTGRDYLPALQRNSELLERFLDLVFNQGKTELIQELFE